MNTSLEKSKPAVVCVIIWGIISEEKKGGLEEWVDLFLLEVKPVNIFCWKIRESSQPWELLVLWLPLLLNYY